MARLPPTQCDGPAGRIATRRGERPAAARATQARRGGRSSTHAACGVRSLLQSPLLRNHRLHAAGLLPCLEGSPRPPQALVHLEHEVVEVGALQLKEGAACDVADPSARLDTRC